MACPFCAYGIEKKLLETPSVRDLKVLMDEGKIVLPMQDHTKPGIPALYAAVRRAGFLLHSILVDEAAGQLSRDSEGLSYSIAQTRPFISR